MIWQDTAGTDVHRQDAFGKMSWSHCDKSAFRSCFDFFKNSFTALSGLPVPSFFSQIAAAILFKKKDRPTSKIAHKIYNDKNQNSF